MNFMTTCRLAVFLYLLRKRAGCEDRICITRVLPLSRFKLVDLVSMMNCSYIPFNHQMPRFLSPHAFEKQLLRDEFMKGRVPPLVHRLCLLSIFFFYLYPCVSLILLLLLLLKTKQDNTKYTTLPGGAPMMPKLNTQTLLRALRQLLPGTILKVKIPKLLIQLHRLCHHPLLTIIIPYLCIPRSEGNPSSMDAPGSHNPSIYALNRDDH
jgi:hypothetical protein